MSEGTSPVVATTAAPDAAGFVGTAARRQWRTVAARFVRHRAALVGLMLFALLLAFAFVGPLVWPKGLDAVYDARRPPSAEYPFGTDRIGRDMLAQTISGTRYSLQIALTVALVATALGVTLGALAGYRRGWVDAVVGRTIDLVLCIPALVVTAVLARNTFTIAPGATNRSNWLAVALIIALLTPGCRSHGPCAEWCCRCGRRSSSRRRTPSAARPRTSCSGTSSPTPWT